MKKIKVLEIGLLNPFIKGGVESFIWNTYTNYDLDKFQIDFWGINCTSDDKYMQYLNKHHSELFVFYSSKNKVIKQFEKIKHIKNIVKNNKYDCVHIHAGNAFATFIYYSGVISVSKNIIIHSHSAGDKIGRKLTRRNLLNSFFKHLICGKNIIRLACSESAGKWMYPGNYKYDIVKNGIDIPKFIYNEQIRKKIRLTLNIDDKFVVGHIGRFSYEKNHEFLIEIFDKIYKKNKNSILLLVGNGSLEKQIRKKVHNLGLDDAVIFYGTTPNVYELYQAMDCFVLPSYFEGMPIVLIESQTAALKSVCSDTITNEAKITNLLEYMPLSSSAKAWADKILSYNDGYVRKDVSREIEAAGYDIVQSAKQLEKIYCECATK